jgi:hypothetical protein
MYNARCSCVSAYRERILPHHQAPMELHQCKCKDPFVGAYMIYYVLTIAFEMHKQLLIMGA